MTDVRKQAGLKTHPRGFGLPPVKWLSVRQLLRTGEEVALASAFAKFADKRETMAGVPGPVYELPAADSVRVDFVADTGDGLDATLSVARLVSSGQTPAGTEEGPAELLILGGDEVYPVASAEAYRQRLVRVLRAARLLAPTFAQQRPFVFALPGNHDWYDGLTAFRRTFCESWAMDPASPPTLVALDPSTSSVYDDVGGWRAPQTRSYFAVRVHPRWWVWGIDSQLDAPVDAAQLQYFRRASALLAPEDRVVVCTATPSWLEAAGPEVPPAAAETPLWTLTWCLRRVLGPDYHDRVRLVLTGDKHHYAHYAPATGGSPAGFTVVDGPHLVTCGGGGAFTSSTHHLPDLLTVPWRRPTASASGALTHYQRQGTYPSKAQSRAMRWGTWRMGLLNGPIFPGLVGLVLLGLFATVRDGAGDVLDKGTGFAVLGVLVVLGAFASNGVKHVPGGLKRRAALATAAVTHTVAYVAVAVDAATYVWPDLGGPRLVTWLVAYLAFVLLGTLVFTTYLRACDEVGWHELESFSAMRSTRHKALLRLTFTSQAVDAEVIGLDQVPASRATSVTMTPTSSPALSPHQVDTFSVPR